LAIAASPSPPDTAKEAGYERRFKNSTTISRKYAYADDLAIMHADGDLQAVEGVLTKDMATIGEYFQSGKLKLSTTKTVSAAFHLNSKEGKRELKVKYNETLPFCSEPKYL